jgi:acyl-coenzyme A synthetase/AMP-(fatty) acid ligase
MSALVESVREEMATRSYDVVVEDLPAFHAVYPNLFGGDDVEEAHQQPLPSADVYPGGVEIWLHSSGSTGQPKPLPMTHDFLAKLQYAGKSINTLSTTVLISSLDGYRWLSQQAPPISESLRPSLFGRLLYPPQS